MVPMKKLMLWVLLSLFSSVSFAEIKVELEPSQVTMGETFKLSITQEDQQGGGVPDLTELQKDFVILGTERHVNYSIINGQAQSQSQWVVLLRALKPGIFTIPPIKVGLEQSLPITINVQANAKTQALPDDAIQKQDVFLTAEVNEKKPYVNQQIIYTVKLYNSKRLLDADYQGPKVDDALLIPLGDAKRYHAVHNNINYVVEEQTYAIYPQKSGSLKIISPTFNALVYDYNPQRIKATDKTINLTIKPIPDKFQGKLWLPAKQVKLSEQYENSNQTLSQGSTLTRTVTLEGVGIPAQLLPSLAFDETNFFSVYPEKGAERNQVKQGDLIGSVEIKVTYLFNKAGKTTIPELRLPWFNTETGKEEIAVLPPRSLDIIPSTSVKTNTANPQVTDKEISASSQSLPDSDSVSNESGRWAVGLAIFFGLAWLLTLSLWVWQRRPRDSSSKKEYKKALDALNKACNECNPKKARDAVLKWASVQWPDAPILNLTDLAQLVRDVHLKKQLHLLSQVLYRSQEKTLWRGDELLRAVHAVKRNESVKKRKNSKLPPINPL
ncbi:TPA: protein BatD [Legionella pneumophila]|nr:protein BatD [Legionella pneumophila]RYW29487.1 protein BatD [Legionella pneumophila]HAT8586427.1 protein BatD [Legionella pneumophila]HAU1573304.1 protein BatD [Legionella pneumophila]HAU1855258.1 protein BatD [Legionella pneumophila]